MLHFYAVRELKNLGTHVCNGARYRENKSISTCVQKSTIFVPAVLSKVDVHAKILLFRK